MHFLELYSSDDRTKIERKHTFPMHNLSADRSPKEISLSVEGTLMKLQQMALFPWHGRQLGQFPGHGLVSLLDMLGWVKCSNGQILVVKDTWMCLKRVLVS